jgi:hypothetical protein
MWAKTLPALDGNICEVIGMVEDLPVPLQN